MVNWIVDHLALIMFGVMFLVIFCGYPVAFVLGGTGLVFAVFGWWFDAFPLAALSNLVLRMWGGVATDPVLTSIPMFIFMGTPLERSGAAKDMLEAAQTVMGRAPGGLAGVVALAPAVGENGASKVLQAIVPVLSRLVPKLALDPKLDLANIARDPEVVRAHVADPQYQVKVTARMGAELLAATAETRERASEPASRSSGVIA